MEQYPNLPSNIQTFQGFDTNSETSSGDWESEILRPKGDYFIDPTELRNFGKFSKLTREGRDRVKSLRSNSRREALLERNPSTPITSSTQSQARFNTPIQTPLHNPKPKGTLSKLLSVISLSEDQFKFSTPKVNPLELVEQEQTDFLVPPKTYNTIRRNIEKNLFTTLPLRKILIT